MREALPLCGSGSKRGALERFRFRRNHTKEHALRCASSTGSEKVGIALVLQLCFSLTAVVSGCRFSLVPSSPERPGHDEASSDGWPEQNTGQKIADLRHGWQKRCQAPQAAAGTAGLLSFALPHVA